MHNRIPRQFNRIVAKAKVEFSNSIQGDVFHIFKNDCGYLSLNTRTQDYTYMFASMIRNVDVMEILEIN